MKNTNPVFTLNGLALPSVSAAANLAADGSGTLITLVTAPADGVRIDKVAFINAQATPAASSAMIARLFVTDASGLNPQPVGEVLLAAITRSATVKGASGEFVFSPAIVLESGQLLRWVQSHYAGVADRMAALPYCGKYS